VKIGNTTPSAYALRLIHHGKGVVIFSPLDLTTGLLGANTYGILGYQPAFAQDFVRNVVSGQRRKGCNVARLPARAGWQVLK